MKKTLKKVFIFIGQLAMFVLAGILMDILLSVYGMRKEKYDSLRRREIQLKHEIDSLERVKRDRSSYDMEVDFMDRVR